jgi:hypothetical protein
MCAFPAFEHIETVLGVDVIFQNYSLMENDTGSHSMNGWCKAFRIVDGEHFMMRLNARLCQQCLTTWASDIGCTSISPTPVSPVTDIMC